MERVDVAVVGGGLLGCATAYYLARAGSRVTLLERGELNREASGQNAGSLHFQLEFRMIEHGEAVSEQFALSLPLCLDAQRRWASLEDELGTPLGTHLAGGLMVAETPAQLAALARKSALENREGLATTLLDAAGVQRVAPYLAASVLGACWCPEEGHANPRLVAPAFAAAAVAAGATLRVRSEVSALRRDGSGWRLETRAGESVRTDALVIAAGAWSGELAALAGAHIPVGAHALTIFATAPAPPFLLHLVQHAGERLSLKQTAEGNVLVGGGWPARMRERAGAPDPALRPALQFDSVCGSAAIATRVVPGVASLAAIRMWTGVVAVTDDNVPILGEVPGHPGLVIATAGAGFTLGPTFAALIAEQLLHRRSSLPLDTYSPGRFGSVKAR